MPERMDKWLRICCILLGGLLLYHVARLAVRQAPLAHLKIPPVPTLPVTNAPAATNAVAGTNATAGKSSNSVAGGELAKGGTNVTTTTGTNTNTTVATTNSSNTTNIATAGTNTNATVVTTNAVSGTNIAKAGTNVAGSPTNSAATNTTTNIVAARGATNGAPPPASSRRGGPGALGPDVPPAVRARVEKIVASEIFGPIVRPLPMALLGIAGREAFMRTPTGQTGMMKEGDELGGIKMITIGTNRVLVDEEGQKKELMIFAGIGGETLMPKAKETTNEPIKKLP